MNDFTGRSGRLAGKTALVTGGASGVGRATCRRFVEEGARVLVADIDARGAEVASTLGEAARFVRLDVSREDEWREALGEARTWAGKLDIVCNIAGLGRAGTIEDLTLDDWHAMIAVNLTGTMLGCKLGLAAIIASGGRGAIVNMSSIGGLVGPADIAGYNATKGGVTMLTKAVALHCAEKAYPVRCVSIHPTYIDTEMLNPGIEAAGGDRQARLGDLARLVPIGRIATPDDVANAVLFAASDEAGMISGSGIIVDGAQLAGPWEPRPPS